MERTDMVKMGDILLRLSEDGALTRKEIALSTGVSTGTVSHVQARAVAAGLSWPLPDGVAAGDLRRLLYPPRQTGKTAWLEPDLADMAQALKNQKTGRAYRSPRVTREVLWDSSDSACRFSSSLVTLFHLGRWKKCTGTDDGEPPEPCPAALVARTPS